MRPRKNARGPLGMGYVVVKPDGTTYVAEDGEWIFDKATAMHILGFVGGKIDDAAYYA